MDIVISKTISCLISQYRYISIYCLALFQTNKFNFKLCSSYSAIKCNYSSYCKQYKFKSCNSNSVFSDTYLCPYCFLCLSASRIIPLKHPRTVYLDTCCIYRKRIDMHTHLTHINNKTKTAIPKPFLSFFSKGSRLNK